MLKSNKSVYSYIYIPVCFSIDYKTHLRKAVLGGIKTGNEALKIIMAKQNVQRIKTCMQYYDGLRCFLDN